MKTKAHLAAPSALIATLIFAGCAGPAVRHDNRVDRRVDTAERVDTRSTNRQDTRHDRQGDRHQRIENRY